MLKIVCSIAEQGQELSAASSIQQENQHSGCDSSNDDQCSEPKSLYFFRSWLSPVHVENRPGAGGAVSIRHLQDGILAHFHFMLLPPDDWGGRTPVNGKPRILKLPEEVEMIVEAELEESRGSLEGL